MAEADVSVIMPAWRAATTVGRALDSVAAQTLRPREVIVVDDGSQDGTAEAAEACLPRMNGIRLVVLRQPNQGAGAARNRAIAEATGRWLAFLDSDDEWLPAKLERSLAALNGTQYLFASHDMVAVAPGGGETAVSCHRHFAGCADPFRALMLRGFVATSTVVARRDAVKAADGFEPGLPAAQDYDLWLKLAARPGGFLVFAGALTRYHVNPRGITSNIERRRRCSQAVLERHLPVLAARGGGLSTGLKRLAIIAYEAASAHWLAGRRVAALAALVRSAAALPQVARCAHFRVKAPDEGGAS